MGIGARLKTRARVAAAGMMVGALLLSGPVAVAAPVSAKTAVTAGLLPAAKGKQAKVTTANLNLRRGAGTSAKSLLVIPKGSKLTIAATSGGWSKTTFKSKTGWVSSRYLATAPASKKPAVKKPAVKKSAAKPAAKKPALAKTTAKLNLRQKATTGSKVVGSVPKGVILPVQGTSATWKKVAYRGKTGWISGSYVKNIPNKPGREIYLDGAYKSNRAGLTDRYYTKTAGSDLYLSVKGELKIGDIPRNSVSYRDLAQERKAGGVSGWYFVRTQGTYGWMKTSQLQRKSTAKTSNAKKLTRTQVRRQINGKVPASMLVAIPWDREKTLIAAPALADLTRLNAAFKKKFGRNLDIDLAYRTRATQDYYWKDLGPFIAARPGTSNHGWGLAIDLPETHDYSFRGKYYKWMKVNSKKYNWVHQKYLEEGSPYAEAWHFEYTGR